MIVAASYLLFSGAVWLSLLATHRSLWGGVVVAVLCTQLLCVSLVQSFTARIHAQHLSKYHCTEEVSMQ